MARKSDTASAEQSDAPVEVARVSFWDAGDGVTFPALAMSGDAPRKGSSLRVRLPNGVVYTGKVAGHEEADGETLVLTEGLTPEVEPTPAPPPSDIVPG